eukprot:CAMPEP_0175854966 /NCGR_PEP_ID=MMETSP0107_2-20121207/27656_1 /TAXON_ID=195067 ORGANISM="Goniomonas pacifica, Strain CCMP1869" /NCGR_SAMPLE_ID=MMETSP0107_2 /ASSEMBLY_ACC=CAM_ASM_000203 /LENGTH=87 /DNA_ID=CAMNT_0017170859 /DNA_START=340 /DNA_END=603 /DNA_ORIENTATION=+
MAMYDPEAAKAGVQEMHEKVKKLTSLVEEGDLAGAKTLYGELPDTYQINWGMIDVDAAEVQKLADDAQAKIQDGLSCTLPRAFNGNK